CTRETAGICDRVERDYTCLNGPFDASPASLKERRFTEFEERLESNCAQTIPASCSYFSTDIIQGGSTRNFNGKNVTRSWWERAHAYNCDESGYVNSCSPYENNPVCRQTAEPVCQSYGDDGKCAYASYSYTCESDTSFTADCDGVDLCADGACDGAPEEASSDYAEASAWLNFLDDMADKNQCDADATALVEEDGVVVDDCTSDELDGGQTTPEIFGGAYMTCLKGFNNCCGTNIANSCKPEEHELAAIKRAGAAHFLGWECNYVLGGCLTVNEFWCTYDTKFARVFQEEAHVQTGTQLNYPSTSPCPALSITELKLLDISQMDLSEVYGDLLSQTGTPVEAFIIDQLETELGSYQSDVQNTLE
ncbi:MAG: conjugal transfer protein TraN, partial [Paracoccaceae bacterium]|nr:conjugal transfer protein TraN [Paracoccaceae bacterium]